MNYNVVIEDSLFQKIGKIKVCHICVIMLFFLSFINSGLLISFLLLSPIILLYQEGIIDGSLYMLLYVQTRSILNKSLAFEFTGLPSIIKWFIVFILSFLLIYNKKQSVNRSIFRCLIIYFLWLVVVAFCCSSYPLVSTFKALAFAIPFYAMICGVASSQRNWLYIINHFLGLLVLLSVIAYVAGIGYFATEYGQTDFFCGAINHPNLLGTILILCVSSYLSNLKKLSLESAFYILLLFVMVYVCRSRAAFFYFLVILCLYILVNKSSINVKVISFISIFIIVIVSIFMLSDFLISIMHKYGSDDIMGSRTNQLEGLLFRIKYNPLMGTGFNVPFIPKIRDYIFSFDLVVENGNLILSIIADSGIVGLLLFSLLFYNIYILGSGTILFIAPMLVSMSEMVFFSTNNIGIFLYMFYAIYLTKHRAKVQPVN